VQHELQHDNEKEKDRKLESNVRSHDRDAVGAENEDATNLLLQVADDAAKLHKLQYNFADEVTVAGS
jgi:hypothetical protein